MLRKRVGADESLALERAQDQTPRVVDAGFVGPDDLATIERLALERILRAFDPVHPLDVRMSEIGIDAQRLVVLSSSTTWEDFDALLDVLSNLGGPRVPMKVDVQPDVVDRIQKWGLTVDTPIDDAIPVIREQSGASREAIRTVRRIVDRMNPQDQATVGHWLSLTRIELQCAHDAGGVNGVTPNDVNKAMRWAGQQLREKVSLEGPDDPPAGPALPGPTNTTPPPVMGPVQPDGPSRSVHSDRVTQPPPQHSSFGTADEPPTPPDGSPTDHGLSVPTHVEPPRSVMVPVTAGATSTETSGPVPTRTIRTTIATGALNSAQSAPASRVTRIPKVRFRDSSPSVDDFASTATSVVVGGLATQPAKPEPVSDFVAVAPPSDAGDAFRSLRLRLPPPGNLR